MGGDCSLHVGLVVVVVGMRRRRPILGFRSRHSLFVEVSIIVVCCGLPLIRRVPHATARARRAFDKRRYQRLVATAVRVGPVTLMGIVGVSTAGAVGSSSTGAGASVRPATTFTADGVSVRVGR